MVAGSALQTASGGQWKMVPMRQQLDPIEARQGQKTGVVRRVLVISSIAAAVALALILIWFVASPPPPAPPGP